MCWKVHSRFLCIASLSCHSLVRQLGCGSAFRASTSSRHSRLRAGILGGLMRGIASPVFHPRTRLPRPRVGARGDGAVAPFVPSHLSALPLHSFHHVIPASEWESSWRGLVRSYPRPLPRLPLSETLHATSLPSPPTPRFWFAYAPIGLRFGNPCKHGCAHLAPIVPARRPA